MSNATKCDRCGACYEYGGMTVGEEYDLCDGCVADFEEWIDAGMHGEHVTESAEMSHDTREQLESDVQKFAQVYYADHLLVHDKVMALLYRQAAITERECREYENALREQHHKRIAELKAEIATLKEHRAANMEKLHELTDECAELRKYRDEWRGLAEKYRADSIAAQEETERYRAKLGDVLDAIHEAERAAR